MRPPPPPVFISLPVFVLQRSAGAAQPAASPPPQRLWQDNAQRDLHPGEGPKATRGRTSFTQFDGTICNTSIINTGQSLCSSADGCVIHLQAFNPIKCLNGTCAHLSVKIACRLSLIATFFSPLFPFLPLAAALGPFRSPCVFVYLQVLLLSFSLLISSNLQPGPYSQLGRGEYTQSRGTQALAHTRMHARPEQTHTHTDSSCPCPCPTVPSRSLHSAGEVRDPSSLHHLSASRGFRDGLTEKL